MLQITEENLGGQIGEMTRPRDPCGHKGNFGTAAVIAGSACYRGCATLNCMGALRSGCGIVRLISTERVISSVVIPEVTFMPAKESAEGMIEDLPENAFRGAGAVLFGSGLGTGPSVLSMLMKIPKGLPAVIDADGLNSVAVYGSPDVLSGRIITPHTGEFARLLNTEADDVMMNREGFARTFAERYGVTVVLKDAVTVVASPGCQGAWVSVPNSGMAKGGSGDLLGGVIVSLLAQGYGPYEAALLGVLLHCRAGLAAKNALGEANMLPSDAARYICRK